MGNTIDLLKERERILLENARAMVYRSIPEGEDLSMHLYLPRDLEESSDRPLLLFFHGGAWDRGTVIQFAPHALYYVERGAVCGLVEYQHKASHPDSTPTDAIQDAMLAVQFVRHHAEKLHVNPQKIIAVGTGSGGNIAAGAGMGAHKSTVDSEFSHLNAQPNGVVMLSSIIDIEKGGYGHSQFKSGSECRKASLSNHISSSVSPMLMIHGTADRLVPFDRANEFAERMKKRKAPFKLVEFEGRDQNFFSHNTDPVSYEAALSEINEFLDTHGFLKKGEEDDESQLISWRECDY